MDTPPTSTESESSFSPEDPRPRYYICRDDKTLVPLIAVDELPPIIHLHGVPLSLAAADIEEWDMSRCGDVIDRAKNLYRIEFNTNLSSYQSAHTSKPPATPHKGKQKASVVSPGDLPQPSDHPQADQETPPYDPSEEAAPQYPDSENKNIDYESKNLLGTAGDYQDAKENIARDYAPSKVQHPSKTPNAATPGIYGRKKYCTYWIRTGNCDYIQEGCKFLHVIPDAETRLRIGIRDMPRWAREDIPAPENEFSPKAIGQDWRRRAQPDSRDPPLGRVTELPEASGFRARAAPFDAAAPAYAGWGNVQEGNQHPQFMHFTNQQSANNFKHTSHYDQSRLNNVHANGALNSASAAAADSFQRQMHSHRSLSPAPASSPRRSSPKPQPPIARPTTTAYTAPDKIQHIERAANVAQNPFGRGFSRDLPKKSYLAPPGMDFPSSSLFRNNQQPRTPMDARFANLSLGSPANTGIAEGTGYCSPDQIPGNATPLLSSRPFGSRYSETFQAANEGTNQNTQFNGNVSPSFFTQPTVTHKRRFVTPGESKFVVTSAAEDNGGLTATAHAGQHLRTNCGQHRAQSGQRRGRSRQRRSRSCQHRRSHAKAQNGSLEGTFT